MGSNFTLQEFEQSNFAQTYKIDNRVQPELLEAAHQTIEMLERIRAYLSELAGHSVPIIISSGYRCLEVNRRTGSAPKSDHTKAAAADWTAPRFGSPKQIALALAPKVDALGIGQLIYEQKRWLHTSTITPVKPINRVITINSKATRPGIVD